jgi:caffeoyl-CoA O-methyltransferase
MSKQEKQAAEHDDQNTPSEMMTPEQYVESLYAQDPDLERVARSIQSLGMHDISVAPAYGRLLTLLVSMCGAKQALEIGALAGYSGICIARGLAPGGRLVSLEREPKLAELAGNNLAEAGLGDKVEYRVGEALDGLEQLRQEGASFDFFFIDADKANYIHYLEWAIQLGSPGAIIVGDNALMRGRTVDPRVTAGSVRKMREFNQAIATDPRLESTILPGYDGLCIARIK